MNVLHHLAMQSEALVILLQETHCTDAEKLVLPNYQLAGSSLIRKHGLATFVHERLRYTLLDQSPQTSEIDWLCMDVDGYKIVNVYKPPSYPYGKSFTTNSVLFAPLPLPSGAHQKNPYVPYTKPSFAPSSPMLPEAGFPSHLLLTSPPWRGCIDLPVE